MVKQTINTLAVASNPPYLSCVKHFAIYLVLSLFVRQHYMINYYYSYYII